MSVAPPPSRNRRLGAVYVFVVYLMAAASETYISPFFPLVREELDLVVAQQATLIAVLTFGIGFANVVGGAAGYHVGDRRVIRVAAATMGVGALVSGTAGSFAALVVGQAVAGVGIGLFFAPGLASIGRMFAESRGRAVASYGLGYSVGTGIAALAAGINGVDWRWPFYVTAVLCVGLAVFAPPLPDSIEGTAPPMWASLRRYLREPFYQMSLVTALVAGSITYLFIGFTPTLFVDRGLSLAVAATVVAAGRFASVPSKYVAGWMFDRVGGPRAAQWIMAAIAACGVPVVVMPGGWGLVFLAPFVMIASSLFPVSNALSVAGLPERSSWGIGVYRALLVGSSAVVTAVAGLLLRHFSLSAVMLGSLLLPVAGALAASLMTRQRALALSRAA